MTPLENVQILREGEQAKFAVIPFEEYLFLKDLLSDEEKLADYLDYLHVQNVKEQTPQRLTLEEVRRALALE